MVVCVLVGWSGAPRCPCLHCCRLWLACWAWTAVLLPLRQKPATNYLKKGCLCTYISIFCTYIPKWCLCTYISIFCTYIPSFVYIFSISSCSHRPSLSEPECVIKAQVRKIYNNIESEGMTITKVQWKFGGDCWQSSKQNWIRRQPHPSSLAQHQALHISSLYLQLCLTNICQLAYIHQCSDSIWGVAVQWGVPRMLAGVTGDVVHGSRVNLVHLACACSAGIGFGSIGPCRGCSLYKGCFNLL